MSKTLLLCDCLGSQTVDATRLSAATGAACSGCYSSLCTTQIDVAAKAIQAGDVTIACAQEAHRFSELAEELDAEQPQFVDIRDRAGWTDDKASTTAKMAALIADAALPAPSYKSIDVVSEGTCLIIGPQEAAMAAADKLADTLSVTVLLVAGSVVEPTSAFDVVVGHLHQASGTIGQFEVKINAFQAKCSRWARNTSPHGCPRWRHLLLRYYP